MEPERASEKLDDLSTEESKVFRELKRRIKIRKEQPAFHPDATQFTLQLPNHFWFLETKSLSQAVAFRDIESNTKYRRFRLVSFKFISKQCLAGITQR